jgi:N-methylhydantoinase A
VALIVGVDVGGTFTDVVIADTGSGAVRVAKVASTPSNQSLGFMRGVSKAGVEPAALEIVMHGTTVATNAVLEGEGARVGMLVTSGFRDVLEIGRGERSKLYDLKLLKQPPLIPRSDRIEVPERTRPDGSVVVPVTREAIAAALASHRGEPFAAWVVCFLHSYANPSNEEQAAALLRELAGEVPVTVSSGVVAEYREYERFSTAVLNAFVAPKMDRYLRDIETRLADAGYRRSVFVMHSSGGIMTARAARRLPAATILSGPAGGVAGALAVAEQAGISDFVTCDMGGTSTDVCLVKAGSVRHTTEARIAGYPTRLPQLDIVTVGAGGGSIATVGVGPVLRVGPQSAGARPGPACYGMGGTAATVTDANLVLNRLDPSTPLSGEIALQPEQAWTAIEKLASALGGLDVPAMAEGIVRLAVVRMAGAIRQVSVYRGHNPRDFTLLAFGGAGPLVASELASELGIKEVVIPPYPGNLSALGLLVSPLKRDFVRTRIARLADLTAAELEVAYADLESRATREFQEDTVPGSEFVFTRTVDLRYVGQSFTINVPISARRPDPLEVERSFHEAHQTAFGHAAPGEPVELVNLRLAASLPGARVVIRPPVPPSGEVTERHARPVFFAGRQVSCAVYERSELPLGIELDGPLIVQEPGSSTVVWPGDRLRIDAHANLRLQVGLK